MYKFSMKSVIEKLKCERREKIYSAIKSTSFCLYKKYKSLKSENTLLNKYMKLL